MPKKDMCEEAVDLLLKAARDAVDLQEEIRKAWRGTAWTESYNTKVARRIANNNSIGGTAGKVLVAASIANAVVANALKGQALALTAGNVKTLTGG